MECLKSWNRGKGFHDTAYLPPCACKHHPQFPRVDRSRMPGEARGVAHLKRSNTGADGLRGHLVLVTWS